jgi:hypothetical protein
MGGGREKTGWFELPAESVRGGGLFEASSLFWMRSGPMVGVSGVSPGRRKSSSSGRPCLRPSIADYAAGMPCLFFRTIFVLFLGIVAGGSRCGADGADAGRGVVSRWYDAGYRAAGGQARAAVDR